MATNTTARKNNRPKAVVTTITKEDAFALVKGGELNANKYRRPCHLCGEIVDAGAGVLGGNKTEGWWAAHEGGTCFTPEPAKKTTRKRTTAAKESASASKNVAAETESAAKVEDVKVPVRGTRKVNNNMAAAKKTVARRTTRKAAPAPSAKRPVKRSAPKKVTPNVPEEVTEESASTEEDGAAFAELDETAREIVTQIKTFIANGALDGALGMLDDAIGERLDAIDAENNPKPAAKKTTARKTTTPKTAAEKVAPVKRAAKSTGSASASKPAEVEEEIVKVPRPAKGRDYRVNPKLKNKYAGLKITFKSYVAGSDNKKASVAIREEFEGKPVGSRLTIPVSTIVRDN